MSTNYPEFKKLYAEFENSRGFKVLNEIADIQRSVRIVARNEQELVEYLSHLKQQEVFVALADMKNRIALTAALEELARRMENFLSSAFALVDHTRRHRKNLYGEEGFDKEVQQQIREHFFQDSDHELAQGLRVISSHVETLLPSMSLTWSSDEGEQIGYKLPVKQLLQWDEWGQDERKALQSMKDNLDIQEFVERYYKKIEGFYTWLWKRQQEIHSEEIEQSEKARIRAKEADEKLVRSPKS